MVSTLGCPDEQLLVLDSFYDTIDDECAQLLLNFFPNRTAKMGKCQKQIGGTACGIFAIANATSIAYGVRSDSCFVYEQDLMKKHLISCTSLYHFHNYVMYSY